ncbi:putative periplasmic sensor histidine kinase [endosymbiont of Acanthamoeba sp. UWC8]|uniref:sodium:solute symporter family transporter n=1 Tax=endosymbiont of Acanthamoeba sp. UWC8 TaxID=86106 RepID=UPI0004D1028B|nr:ATP-binding protein [endosymbiont of Acanthamoeba sp. UWC8]AIF81618.1 putative periplasmic sensor histidine kinase [endosymbiont of Acanthamoeba sp. UWC8]
MLKLNYIDLLIVVVFLSTCLIIGLYRTTKINTIKEFALGFKNISVIVLVCAVFSSSIGAAGTLGAVGKIYEFGAVFVVIQLLSPLYWLITIKVIANNIERFKKCMTLGEIMYKLYGAPGRWIIAIASTLRSLGSIAAQALALGLVFNYFLGIETGYGILIGYGIIAIYSALGGIRAVIHTEVFKFAVFFFIIPISYIVIFSKTGGLENFVSYLPNSHLNIKLSKDNISLLTSFALYSLLPGIDPAFIQRCLIARDTKQLKAALKMIALISIPFSAALCLIAYEMRMAFPNIMPDEVLLKFISLLPMGLKGIMVSGLMAIIMSVGEAKINATSIILVNDVLKVLRPTMSNTMQLGALRVITIILSISSLFLIKSSRNILDIVWLVSNFWGPTIFIPVASGFLGFKTNSKSFMVSVIFAMIFTLSTGIIVGDFAIMSWSFGILGSAIGLFGMHYYQVSKGWIQVKPTPKVIKDSMLSRIVNTIFDPVKNTYKFLISSIKLLAEDPGQHKIEIRKFCTFTLSYYFLYSLDVTSSPGHVTFAYLITIGYFFCMVLLFREFIVSKRFLEKYLHYYWYFLITFCLPFVSSYMLFIGFNDPFWVVNGILSAFSLYLFVDARRFLLLYSIGTLGGFILFKQSGFSLEAFQEITTTGRIAYIYLFFLFATLFFLRKREKEQEERVETMHIFGGAMAHEVKSPLATLNMCAVTINNLFQGAFDNKKVKDNTYTFTLDKEEGDTLLEFTQMLTKVSSQGISTVDGLLASLKSTVIADDKKNITIEECVTASILEYKLLNPEKDGVVINIVENFLFYGSMHYIKRLLSNLLNNAYKYGGRNVKIEIRAESNKLYFRDNGKGISEDDIPYIFDKFYTKSKSGTGIGLAFCKMIMHDMGGYIECKSRIGKYTEFILTFPALKKKKKKTVKKQ